MTGEASQAGDADSSRAPGITSDLQGPVNVHRGALLLVQQWQHISSLVFYITGVPVVHVLVLDYTAVAVSGKVGPCKPGKRHQLGDCSNSNWPS